MAKTFSNTSMKLFDTVDEMYEQWVNGNRRSVVKAILESSTKRAAFLAVALSQKLTDSESLVLNRALIEEASEEIGPSE